MPRTQIGAGGVIVAKSAAADPFPPAIDDINLLSFDSRNPDQMRFLQVQTSLRATYSFPATGTSYHPPGSTLATATHELESFGIGGDIANELTRNTLGLDYPPFSIARKRKLVSGNYWIQGIWSFQAYDQDTQGNAGGYTDTVVNFGSGRARTDGYGGMTYPYLEWNVDGVISNYPHDQDPFVIVHTNLPADQTAIPFPAAAETPGDWRAHIGPDSVKIARPGFEVDTAVGEEMLLDSDRPLAHIIAAGETAIGANTTIDIDLPPGIDYSANVALEYVAWEGATIRHPYYDNTPLGFKQYTLFSRVVDNGTDPPILKVWNPQSYAMNVRYVVWGYDDNAPTSGTSPILFQGNDGTVDYAQIRRPGSADPPTLRDILVDTRFPYCPIVAEGYVSFGTPGALTVVNQTVNFANTTGFKPLPLFLRHVNTNNLSREEYRGAAMRKLHQGGFTAGPYNNRIGGGHCYATITDTSVTFTAEPGNPTACIRGDPTKDERILGVRYYILAIPSD